MKYVYYLVGMCMLSCTYMVKTHEYQPCHFDRANLTVIGNDLDFEDSIVYRGTNDFFAIVLHMKNKSVPYRPVFSTNNNHRNLSTKICYCRDTTWAKQQILDELLRRYPFTLKDSIESYRVYQAYFITPSNLIPTAAPECVDYVFGSNDVYNYAQNLS